jgi:hypothetical protein
MAQATA